MKCIRCGGKVKSMILEHYERWPKDFGLIVFANVPAKECEKCGEVYFGSEVSKKMEAIIESRKRPLKKLSVPVYAIS